MALSALDSLIFGFRRFLLGGVEQTPDRSGINLVGDGWSVADNQANQSKDVSYDPFLGSKIYNVQVTYGATGDGVANDLTKIQDAVDAAGAAGGGIVYLPIGVYRITDKILLNANDNNVWLVFEPGAKILCDGTVNYNGIQADSCSGGGIINVTIESLPVPVEGNPISLTNVTDFAIQNATIINTYRSFSIGTGCRRVRVDGCKARGQFHTVGFNISGSLNNIVSGVKATNLDLGYNFPVAPSGAWLTWTTDETYAVGDIVLNNTAELFICTGAGDSALSGPGPQIPGTNAATAYSTDITDATVTWRYLGKTASVVFIGDDVDDLQIHGVTVRGGQSAIIAPNSTRPPTNVSISRLHVSDTRAEGYRVDAGKNFSLSDFSLVRCGGPVGDAILLGLDALLQDTTISNGVIEDASDEAISVREFVDGLTITGVDVRGANGNGVELIGACKGINITGCCFTGCGIFPITLDSAVTDSRIMNNVFRGNGNDTVNTPALTVTSNTITIPAITEHAYPVDNSGGSVTVSTINGLREGDEVALRVSNAGTDGVFSEGGNLDLAGFTITLNPASDYIELQKRTTTLRLRHFTGVAA